MRFRDLFKSAIIGGVITGILVFVFSLTSIELGCCCCCFLYILSGVITAHLLARKHISSDKDYLISGALSGGIAGFVSWLLYTLKEILYFLLEMLSLLSPVVGFGDYQTAALYIGASIMTSGMIFILEILVLFILFFVYPLLGATFGVVGTVLYRLGVEAFKRQ
ncbi:MAG TPA: hypothetical protein EYH55_01155 [Methanothermococcus okinawensis]|uniref:Uncharacterized protein n=1 Tax=Methanothermococcus okinawensis TaxID=155863 RepID=A0A833A646_9EURY|nr:hypothetical protein [Methanothermococcus okinawensis]